MTSSKPEPFTSAADAYDHHVDRYGAQLVVQLMDDRDAGVAEMIRVTGPGGVITTCVRDSTTMSLLRRFWDAALDVAPQRAGAIDDGRRVGCERDGDLGELWEAHGLLDVTTGELWVTADYSSFDDLFEPFTAGAGSTSAAQTPGRDRPRRRRARPQAWHPSSSQQASPGEARAVER